VDLAPFRFRFPRNRTRDARLCRDARDCDGGVRQERWRREIMTKKRRIYRPRIVGGQIMQQADFERLYKYMSNSNTPITSPTR
jgi:hypothetical protein